MLMSSDEILFFIKFTSDSAVVNLLKEVITIAKNCKSAELNLVAEELFTAAIDVLRPCRVRSGFRTRRRGKSSARTWQV